MAAQANSSAISTAEGIASSDTIYIDATNSLSVAPNSIPYGSTPTTLSATVTSNWAAPPSGSTPSSFVPPGSDTIAVNSGTAYTATGSITDGSETYSASVPTGLLPAGSATIGSTFTATTAGSNYSLDYTLDGTTPNTTNTVSAANTLTVTRATTGLSTTIDDAATSQAISGNQALGTSIYDTATVTGISTPPTGTVTYYFYNTASPVYGTTTPVSTQTVNLKRRYRAQFDRHRRP